MGQDDDATDTTFEAARFAEVTLSMTYPIVSAWEFDFLREEEVIRRRWDGSTIYMVVQRPLTYFDNVVIGDGHIRFEIADGDRPPIACRVDLAANGICGAGEAVEVVVGFHAAAAGSGQPLRNVGAFQVFGADGRFILWWSPQKLLYEMLVNGLAVETAVDANPHAFLDFEVHYIGKSFSQKVWNRLAGHRKLQRILTREREVGTAPEARAPFEISLLILRVVAFSDIPMIGAAEGNPMLGPDPIVHRLDLSREGAYERFAMRPPVTLGDEALTTEVEAMLINRFRPKYNEVLFHNYPDIRGGMREKGYSWTALTFEQVPALLHTEHFSMMPPEG